MLATSENVLFRKYFQVLIIGRAPTSAGSSQYRWLAGRYDMEKGHFQKLSPSWLPGG